MTFGAIVPAQLSPSRVINWTSTSGRPEVITVTFVPIVAPGIYEPVLFNSLNPFRADVSWGIGPAGSSAVVDYPIMGGTFTVTTSRLTVDVYPEGYATWAGSNVTVFNDVQIGAWMSLGASRPSDITPATFTRVQDNVAAYPGLGPNGGRIPIPRHARAYYIQENYDLGALVAPPVNVTTWHIDVENRGTPYPEPGVLTNLQRVDYQTYNVETRQRSGPTPLTPFPLPPRATHLNIIRTALPLIAPPNALQAVFVLDLGA